MSLSSDKTWRPRSRIVVSLTTLPHRFMSPMFQDVLQSITGQSLKPDAIYLTLPLSVRGGLNYSEEVIARLPREVTVLRPARDLGSASKLLFTLAMETHPDTIIVTVDDDFFYPQDSIRVLAWNSVHRPTSAHGHCGWGFLWTWPTGAILFTNIPSSLYHRCFASLRARVFSGQKWTASPSPAGLLWRCISTKLLPGFN